MSSGYVPNPSSDTGKRSGACWGCERQVREEVQVVFDS